jgi:D,D-heptose 1,7-bisphosphate phosphatase
MDLKSIQMKAVILAGGKGSRLGELTSGTPKPMIPIGGKPLLHHQVDLLVRYDISEIIILVNYLKEPVISYFGDGSAFHASISYFEEPEPLGTVGGIKAIEDKLTEDFLVFYGDVMINMDVHRLVDFHRMKKSQCTLVLHPNDHPSDSDLVEADGDDRIVAFHPKPHFAARWYHNMVNAGAYVMSPEVLSFLEPGKKADFGRDVFPAIFRQLQMFGYHTSEYLKDMGTPERLHKVQKDWETGRIMRANYEYSQKAIFLDRDGVMNVEQSYISTPEELELFDYTAQAVKKINHSDFLSVVVTNQSAVARNLCTEDDVRLIHKKMETLLGKQGAWLDAIYYCPHHPDKGFPEENPEYKIDCECRKPKIGLFRRAIEKFNISAGDSYMIGDSERDIKAGFRAGCTTIGVRTGYGLRKTRILPDYTFNNLSEAVDFIVDDPLRPVFENFYKSFQDYHGSTPWIILIGGNARTGKSTLAAYLRIAFTRAGLQTLQVGLDSWILPEHKRAVAMNVYERFQLVSLESDILRLMAGQSLDLHTYVNHPDREPIPIFYDPSGARIIIIEGVVALSSENIRKLSHLKIFTRLTPGQFVARLYDYYSWRGKHNPEIESLMQKREMDEYQLIEKESKFADMIINASSA